MFVLITYDVETLDKAGQKRLRQVAKACTDYGQRVQNSVFECDVSDFQLSLLKNRISEIIDKEKDSIRIYFLNRNMAKRVEVIGKVSSYDVNDVLLI